MDAQQQPPPPSGDGVTSHIAGMTKSQLYDVMCQMKALIEQNQQQARQILVDNPLLTRALFQVVAAWGGGGQGHQLQVLRPQAQIMLGMVRPPQVIPNIQKALSQSQSTQVVPQPKGQNSQPLPVEVGQQGPAISSSQPLVPARQQNPMQTTASTPPLAFQLQPILSNPPLSAPQTKGISNALVSPAAPSQSSQIHNVPIPPPPVPQYSVLQPQLAISSQAQQSLQTPGHLHQPPAPPLPQQPRPPSVQPFPHQLHSQVSHGLSFQQSSQPLLSQPIFHPGNNPPSFPQGQPPLPIQPPSQQLYQGGPHVGPDYGSQPGTLMQSERAPWASGMQERAMMGAQLLGPPLSVPGHMGQGVGGQPSRPPPLSPEMEKALLQQVMSLTPEQIHLLPAEQRQQVIQLQEMLRK